MPQSSLYFLYWCVRSKIKKEKEKKDNYVIFVKDQSNTFLGRGLVATAALQPNTLILSESPTVWTIRPPFKSQACSTCHLFSDTEFSLCCEQCLQVIIFFVCFSFFLFFFLSLISLCTIAIRNFFNLKFYKGILLFR
jgi:hypothetical protein